MSLFQVRAWWEVRCGHDEEFDDNHLIVGNIDNDPSNADKIITASLSGIIRIYAPTTREYSVEHLILESDLKLPILQIGLGRFASNDRSNYLAVLHSRQLCVYSIKAFGGFGKNAQYYELNKKYHHNLDRNAFNFISGPFGQHSRDNDSYSDSLCVQSLDGKFWVFEQEHFAFCREWNNFLIPGCIVYAPFNDSIITMTADMKLYSYSYAVLSTSEQQKLKNLALSNEAKTDHDDEKTDSSKSSKSFHRNWCLNLIDHAVKLLCCRFTENLSPTEHDIVALCEKGIFVVSVNGEIKWQKKLDYNPSTMTSYRVRENQDNLIIATFQGSISIYSACKLIWSARLNGFNCIDMGIGRFAEIDGMQVFLSDDGNLMIGYLGTDPSGYKPIYIESGEQEANWQQIEQDMKETKETIQEIECNEVDEPSDYITLHIEQKEEKPITEWIEEAQTGFINEQHNGELVCDKFARLKTFKTKLVVRYEGTSQYGLTDIQISVDCDDVFVCTQRRIYIEKITGGQTVYEYDLIFYAKKTSIPQRRECRIYAVYLNEDDRIQTNWTSFQLPIELLLHTTAPIKNTKYVYTLDVNGMNPPLPTDLFDDIIEPSFRNEILRTPQALTLMFYCNNYDVTLLLSRKGGKIRVQAGDLEPLWIVLDELLQRLNAMAIKKEALLIALRDELPLNEYAQCIQQRYQMLLEVRNKESNLEKLCNQFRVIQKRLLARYKNKNPTPLNEMDQLLTFTFSNIINETNEIEQMKQELSRRSRSLWSLTHLLWILMKLKFKLDERNMSMLQSYLPMGGEDEIEEGWEEQIEASLVYSLTSCLAKSKKDTKISQHKLGKLKDIDKVLRHIRIVCDRLEKSQRFTDAPTFE